MKIGWSVVIQVIVDDLIHAHPCFFMFALVYPCLPLFTHDYLFVFSLNYLYICLLDQCNTGQHLTSISTFLTLHQLI